MSISNAQASVAFLSGADDLLSRLLLDYSIFEEPRLDGRATGKINKNLRELRMTDQEVRQAKALVRELRSGSASLSKGLETLLGFPSVESFTKKWDDVPLFSNHAKRYILAFRPDCGIAFHETDRYKNPRAGVTARAKKNLAAVTSRRDPASFIEVGVFATRDFKKGDLINLRGGIADLTEEEDDEMRLSGGRSDFSVLWSERKNCFCLLLGPARFVNHDCRNNVEFNLVGSNMSFKAVEDIKQDEELFTHYGAHYFETDNAACLCATCEELQQGAFTPVNKRRQVENETPEPASPIVTRPRRDSSPGPRLGHSASRSSSRASKLPAVNYNESAPVASTSASMTLLDRPASKTDSLVRSNSVPRSKGRPRPPSSRMMPVRGALSFVDALRGKPRLVVQPKLLPPPGYRKHYQWDAKSRSAKYVGPTICKDQEKPPKPKPAPLSLSKSESNLKRRRLDSDSPAPTLSPRSKSTLKSNSSSAPAPRIRPTAAARSVQARVGRRRSGRLSGSLTKLVSLKDTPASSKAKKKKVEAKPEEDSSDLSEAEEGQEGKEEEEEEEDLSELSEAMASDVDVDEEIVVRQDKGKGKAIENDDAEDSEDVEMASVERTASPAPFALPRTTRSRRSLSASTLNNRSNPLAEASTSSVSGNAHLRTVTLDLGFSTSTPIEEDSNPSFSAHSREVSVQEEDRLKPCPVPDREDQDEDDDPRPPDRPRRRISTPNFYSNSTGNQNRQKSQEGTEGGGGASTSNGNGSKKNNSGESSFCEAPSSAGSSGRGSYSHRAARAPNGGGGGGGMNGGGSGSGAGGDDEDERNSRKREVPSDKTEIPDSEEDEKEAGEEEEEEDRKPIIERARPLQEGPEAISALLMLNAALDSGSATPPSAPNSSNIRKGKRPAREGDSEEGGQSRSVSKDAAVPTVSRVKKARIESPSASGSSEEPVSRARSNIRWGKGKPGIRPAHVPPPPPRILAAVPSRPAEPTRLENVQQPLSNSPAIGHSPQARPRARPQPEIATPSDELVGRRTRSKPIPGRLEDVLSAPETLAATGGYDWEKGRYITKHEQLRAPSTNPRPERLETESPSPPPSPRRRRKPSLAITTAPEPAPRPTTLISSASTSSALPPTTATKPTARRSGSPVIRKPAARRRVTHSPVASTSQVSLASPVSSVAPPEGRRATRRSFPIAGGLRDVIYSSSALAATGGWDEESGRYVGASSTPVQDDSASSGGSTPGPRTSFSNVKRSKSATPRSSGASLETPLPPPRPASQPGTGTPDSATRSTRRSNPINQRLEQLVYSSAVGGWDPVKGKYVSQVAARKAATTTKGNDQGQK